MPAKLTTSEANRERAYVNSFARRDFLRIGISVAALAAFPAACGRSEDATSPSPDATEPTETELVAWNSGTILPGVPDGFLWMADAKDFLAEEGLDVEFTIANSSEQIRAAVGNRLDIVLLAAGSGLAAIETEGVDLKMVGVPLGKVRDFLFVRSEITSPEDLVGKRIAIEQPNTSSAIYATTAIEANGISVDEVDLVPTGGDPERVAALLAGRVDAAPGGVENLATIEADPNVHALLSLADIVPDVLQGAWFSTGSVIDEQPENLTAVLQAYVRGIRHAFDNLDEATELAMERLESQPEDEPAIATALEGIREGRFVNPDIDWTDEQVEATQQLNVDLGSQQEIHPPAEVADRQFVDSIIADLGRY